MQKILNNNQDQSASLIIQKAFKNYLNKKNSAMRKIQWMSGSDCTVTFDLLEKQSVNNGLHLYPTGALLNQQIAPLRGELYDGIKFQGVNHESLSGTTKYDLAYSYATRNLGKYNHKDNISSITSKLNSIITVFEQDKIEDNLHCELPFLTIYTLQLQQLDAQLYQLHYKNRLNNIANKIADKENFSLYKEADLCNEAIKSSEVPKYDSSQHDKSIEQIKSFYLKKNLKYPSCLDDDFFQSNLQIQQRNMAMQYSNLIYYLQGEINFMKSDLATHIFLVRAIDPDDKIVAEQTESLQKRISDKIKLLDFFRQNAILAIQNGAKFKFSAPEIKKLEQKIPCPVIFATTNKKLIEEKGKKGGMLGEILYNGEIPISRDGINVIMTNKENQRMLRQFLNRHQKYEVLVTTFDSYNKADNEQKPQLKLALK